MGMIERHVERVVARRTAEAAHVETARTIVDALLRHLEAAKEEANAALAARGAAARVKLTRQVQPDGESWRLEDDTPQVHVRVSWSRSIGSVDPASEGHRFFIALRPGTPYSRVRSSSWERTSRPTPQPFTP